MKMKDNKRLVETGKKASEGSSLVVTTSKAPKKLKKYVLISPLMPKSVCQATGESPLDAAIKLHKWHTVDCKIKTRFTQDTIVSKTRVIAIDDIPNVITTP